MRTRGPRTPPRSHCTSGPQRRLGPGPGLRRASVAQPLLSAAAPFAQVVSLSVPLLWRTRGCISQALEVAGCPTGRQAPPLAPAGPRRAPPEPPRLRPSPVVRLPREVWSRPVPNGPCSPPSRPTGEATTPPAVPGKAPRGRPQYRTGETVAVSVEVFERALDGWHPYSGSKLAARRPSPRPPRRAPPPVSLVAPGPALPCGAPPAVVVMRRVCCVVWVVNPLLVDTQVELRQAELFKRMDLKTDGKGNATAELKARIGRGNGRQHMLRAGEQVARLACPAPHLPSAGVSLTPPALCGSSAKTQLPDVPGVYTLKIRYAEPGLATVDLVRSQPHVGASCLPFPRRSRSCVLSSHRRVAPSCS